MRRVEFTASARGLASVLARQPDATEPLQAAVAAAFAALATEVDDEREWRVTAELHYPEDRVQIVITPTGRVVREPTQGKDD